MMLSLITIFLDYQSLAVSFSAYLNTNNYSIQQLSAPLLPFLQYQRRKKALHADIKYLYIRINTVRNFQTFEDARVAANGVSY